MVSPEYTAETSRFTGEVEWVQLDVDEAAQGADRLISPEDRFRVAMARQ
jgi:arylsulfatase